MNKNGFEIFEAPWLRHQIENHIILGPFSKGRTWASWLLVGVAIIVVALSFFSDSSSANPLTLPLTLIFAGIYSFVFLRKSSDYKKAVAIWCSVKGTMLFVSFVLILIGGIVGQLQNKPDALYLLLLGVVWIPCLEFLPKFKEKQKTISIVRVLITIPIIVLGHIAGAWY